MSKQSPQQISKSYALSSDVMVPMRDGVRLATDIYKPNNNPARWPVILERTPYGKTQPSRAELNLEMTVPFSRQQVAERFVEDGYVFVYQDCRGRYKSEGEFVKYLSEGPDGYDTIEWIVSQPWCDGRVFMLGLSYAAHTQLAAACLNPKGLAGLIIDSGGFSNAFHSGIRQGGALEMKQWTWAVKEAKESTAARNDPIIRAGLNAENLHEWFRAMPWKPGHSPLRLVPEYEAYVFDQWQKGSMTDEWRQVGLCAEAYYDNFAHIPSVYMSSWYDPYIKSVTDNYVALSKRPNSDVRLIMGPWLHGDRNVTHSGDVDFGKHASLDGNLAIDWTAFRKDYFNRSRACEQAERDLPRVVLFLMGGGSGKRLPNGKFDHGGRWIGSTDWPLPAAKPTPFYLRAGGELSREEPADTGVLQYQSDPARPVPTIGGACTSGMPIFAGGAFDQREGHRFFGSQFEDLPLAARSDVLVFETAALTEDVAVIGPIKVVLFIASDCPDTDFTAKLVVVHPPSSDDPRGFAMNLTDGILRCRYRDSWENPAMMERGRIYEISIEPLATCNLFKKGQRIRLDIASSNFPKFDINPNTGEPEGQSRLRRIATNSIYYGATYPSRVVLPVVPLESLEYLPPFDGKVATRQGLERG